MLLLILFISSVNAFAQNVPITKPLILKLKMTKAVNLSSVIKELQLARDEKKTPNSFTVPNPYFPHLIKTLEVSDHPIEIKGMKDYQYLNNGQVLFHHQHVVHDWGKLTPKLERDKIVCGVKFLDAKKEYYQLQSFASPDAAVKNGFIVTHQNKCGACSSLQDLAIFLEVRDMTGPGRKCTKKNGLEKMMECNKELGLTRECSEAWAYNSQHTKKTCMKTCVKDYGLFNVLMGRYPGENVGTDGILRPCLLCDELKSGLAYKYITGRSRRSSGIQTDIPRPDQELYPIDYRQYYEEFGLKWQ